MSQPVGRVDPGSFRDPSGFVYERDGRLFRQINLAFGPRWDALASSGLLEQLQSRGLLVPHVPAPVDLAYVPAKAHAVIEPERVPFISYPYEWSFGQLKDAALLTLEAQAIAMASGYHLRDASAYNIQFVAGAPILIDTLSFEPVVGDRPWIAYRQFCEHFLAPLGLMAYRDVRLGLLLRDFIDGIPIDLAATLLPGRTKLKVGLAGHVHAHGRALRRANPAAAGPPGRKPRMGGLRQRALLDSLRRTVEGLRWEPNRTAWAGYAENTSYTDPATASKDALVRTFLTADGGTVWDIGANTGRFSRIAAALGSTVIAWDLDPGVTELHYREVRRTGERAVLPLLLDLANPSPGIGWANRERRSFLDRANADVVLALALVHHLVVGRNVLMGQVADLLAALAPTVIVEYIPETDPMVRMLIGGREDARPYLGHEGFRDLFATQFHIVDDVAIEESDRRLLRLRRR